MTTWTEPEGEVAEAALEAARRVASRYDVPVEDLEQEALIYLATHPAQVEARMVAGGVGYVAWRVRTHLERLALREHRQRGGRSVESLSEEGFYR